MAGLTQRIENDTQFDWEHHRDETGTHSGRAQVYATVWQKSSLNSIHAANSTTRRESVVEEFLSPFERRQSQSTQRFIDASVAYSFVVTAREGLDPADKRKQGPDYYEAFRHASVGQPTFILDISNRQTEQVPEWRQVIDDAIRDSVWIAGLPADWDGQGGSEVTRATWSRAIDTLKALADRARATGMTLPSVSIGPNGHGSIDLFWDLGLRRLLINIPSDPADCPSYSTILGGALTEADYLDSPEKQNALVEFLNS